MSIHERGFIQSSPSTVDRLKGLLKKSGPFYAGTCAIPEHQCMLYYAYGDQPRRIDFSSARPDELDALYHACKPAEFGQGGETFLDPSYREAGKMDLSAFSTLFEPHSLGIHEQVSKALVLDSTMEMHLHKLNVYGEGDFFKAHKDTPQSQDIFGSLIVVLPTPHEGGQIVLRQADKEWTVDFAPRIAATMRPSAFFVAFYGNLEHEVLQVTSGHRVTLTYNFYKKSAYLGVLPSSPLSPSSILTPFRLQLKQALVDLVNDPSVLPEGGYLGFGLVHRYPHTGDDLLGSLPGLLNGLDHALVNVCDALGLPYSFRLFYRDLECCKINLVTTKALPVDQWSVEDRNMMDHIDYALEQLTADEAQVVVVDGEYLFGVDKLSKRTVDKFFGGPMTKMVEITPMEKFADVETALLLYGNEPKLDYFSAAACMFVSLGPAAMRRLNVVE